MLYAIILILFINTRKCSTIRVGGEADNSNGNSIGEDDGDIGGDVGSRKVLSNNFEHVRNCHKREEIREQAVTRKETVANPISAISRAGVNAVQDFRLVTEFEDTLRGIDDAISKFDNAEVDSVLSASVPTLGLSKAQNQLNQLGPVGCDSKGDVEMSQTKGPHANELKPRGWKRLVTERAHAGTQSPTMQSTPM